MEETKKTNWLFIAFVIFLVLGTIVSLFTGDEDESNNKPVAEKSNNKSEVDIRYEKASQDQKNCVSTLGNGVYKDKSLSWKLDSCNVPK